MTDVSKKRMRRIKNKRRRTSKLNRRRPLNTVYRRQQGGSISKTAVVFILNQGAGFGSMFGFLCKTYIYAKLHSYNFFIDHDNWQYTYKNGWHDYFTSLQIYNPDVPYDKVERYGFFSTGNIPNYTLQQYHDCTKEIFKLNDYILNRADEFIKSIGGNYDSIYIRRGDKYKESGYMNIPKLIDSITLDPTHKLFIQTDDIHAVEEIRKLLPNKEVHTTTPPHSKGADAQAIINMKIDDKKIHAEELFVSMTVFLKGIKKYSDNRSNIGRQLKIMGLDSVTLYPFDKSIELPLTAIIMPSTYPF